MKTKLKTYLILFIYALCLVYLWGECFRGYDTNQITCGIGLVLTFVSTFFIQKQFDFKLDIWQKLFFITLMIGDILISTRGDDFRTFLFSPYFLVLLFLIFNFFVFKDLRKFYNNIFFVLLTITYMKNNYFTDYRSQTWGTVDERSIIIDGSENKTADKKMEVPDESIDISTFSFLNLKSDTVNIQSDKPYTFIQTWNEKCPPCKLAIKELTPMLDTIQNIESYFIYENLKFDKNVFVNSAQKEDGLSNQMVLADYNLSFFNSMKMNSYPVFFIIDNQEDKIIYMTVGYGGKVSREKWIEKLEKLASK